MNRKMSGRKLKEEAKHKPLKRAIDITLKSSKKSTFSEPKGKKNDK